MKLRLLTLSLILFTSLSAAQSSNNTTIDSSPGLVKADSPIYSLDVAFDNMLQTAGMVSAGDVAVERASEVAVAHRRNHSAAASEALDQLQVVAQEANNRNREKLQRAGEILNQVKKQVPEQAQKGIKTALQNVERAKNRVPQEFTADSGGALPDIEVPGGAGDRDLDVPGGNTSGR
ncbi:hypothetical protein [Halorarum halobium]|uniref:hypothetical protein n=1 Tax=Halorarum halobium TaxID=3075121 RepID=UPI0028A5EC05|nr:hypothetical protein [Halobaculum sp. XH14]